MKNSKSRAIVSLFFTICYVLFFSNFVSAQNAEFVSTPTSVSVSPNDTFQIVIQVQINDGAIDGAEAHLNFDPLLLKVNGITRLSATELPTEVVGPPTFNNTNGTIDYVAGALGGNNPSANFDFIQIDFEAIAEGNTAIAYNYAFPRPTKITGNFNNVLSNANDVPVAIVVANENPIASFTATPTSGTAALFVSVDASASIDPDGGTIVDYAWNFGDLNTTTGITSDNNYTNPGTYTITLTVTDNDGGIGTATENIVVSGVTIPTYTVTANAGPNGFIDPVSATVDEGGSQIFTITPDTGYEIADVLVGGNSVGAVTTYELTNVLADTNISASFSLINADSTPEITLEATASVNEGGNISVPLLITDADGDALTVSVTSVSNEPQELQSNNNGAQADPYPIDASGFLTENNSNDLGGLYSSNLIFAPVFGDGGSNGDGSGSYTVTISVTDTDGNTVTQNLDLTVNDVHQPISDSAITTIQAESYDNQGPADTGTNTTGIGVEDNTLGGGVVNIGFTNNGDFAEYLIDVATAGTYSFDFSVGKASGAVGTMTVNGGLGEISVNPTGGWQQYTAVNTTVVLPAGQQTLRFDWSGPNGFFFNMDSFLVEFLGGVNAPPSIDAIADVEFDEGETVTAEIQINDDGNSPMIVSIDIYDKSVPGGANDPFTPAETLSGYSFTDNGSGSYTLSWDTDTTDGRSYEARITADDTINPPVIETFTIDVAQDITEVILARTFSSPLPWYGGNPQAPFTVSIETAGNIGWIDNNEFVEYLIDVPEAGDYSLSINAAKGNGNSGLLTVSEENSGSFSSVGSVTVAQTGWGSYNAYTTPITFTNAGVQTLRFDFSGGMNISDLQFTSLTGNTPPIVEILTPNDGLTLEEGSAIAFTATADDSQDGDVATSLVWNSDLDGDFGTGATVNTSALSLGTHTITATATDNDLTTPLTGSTSITVSIYQTAPDCDVRYRVNAGGSLLASSTGDFEEDQAVSVVGGTAQTGTPSPYINLISPAVDKTFGANVPLISNTTGYPDFLFQTERYSDTGNPDNMKWTFPTGDGIYDVKILFNENWTGEINNPRVFDVEIEGIVAFENYRPSGPSGADVNVAKVETYQATVIDGALNINFLKGTQNPAVKGFDICFVAPISNNVPMVAITAPVEGVNVVRGTDVTLSGTASDQEDGDISESLAWSSSDIQFATDPSNVGASITGQFTTPGSQTLRASVSDSDLEEGFDEITVNVSGPEVEITGPSEGDVVSSTDVTLSWTGTDVLFGLTEHYHIFVNPPDVNNINTDTRISTASQIGQEFWDLTAVDGIVEGENTIVIRVANQFHEEFTNPEAQDIVTFTVCSTSITEIVSNDPTDCSTPNGTLVITATGTNLEYSIDGGTDFVGTNSFSDLEAGTYNIIVREVGTTTCTATDTVTLTAPEAPSITSVEGIEPTSCGGSDGQLIINATGSNLEYSIDNGSSFQSTNTFEGLLADTYNIAVRQAGTTSCTAVINGTLQDPMGTMPIITGPLTYLEGSEGVTLDAGAGFASYLWSPGGETTQTITVLEGTYSVTVTETDGCEGTSIGVVVTEDDDITPPEAICQNITLQLDTTGIASITAEDIDNGSNDLSGIADISINNSSFDCSNIGANQVTLTVVDNNGNIASCTATVTVEDSIDPVISCMPNIDILSSSSQVLDITLPTATDNCENTPEITFVRSDNNSLDLTDPFPQGETMIQWTATDASGNSDTCVQTVTITLPQSTDNEILFFSVNGQVGQETIDSNAGTINLTVALGTDITSLSPSITISDQASISPDSGIAQNFSVPVNYVVTAEDNTSTKQWTISITVEDDTTDPEITCPDNIVMNNDAGTCGAVITYTEPVGSDNSPGVTIQQTGGLPNGQIFPIGITTQTYLVEDSAGNSVSCSFTVTVIDAESPVITCPTDVSVTVASGTTSALVTFDDPSISDNCLVADVTQTAGLSSGSIFPLGTTVNTFQVTDAAGNMTTCSFEVTIEEEIVNNVLSVTSFTLVDADTDMDLFTLTNGMTIDINSLPTIHLDVRANTTADVESVSFILLGAQQRTGTESVPPYALFRDTPTGNYLGNDFTVGTFTLTGTPYSGNSASGNTGTPLTIGFELIDGDPDCLDVDITVQATSNPTTCGGSDGSILLSVSGTTGILDYDWGHDANLESGNATGLSAGSYTVTVSDANGCTKTVFANLVDPSPPSVSLAPFSNILTTASPITLSGGLPLGGTYSGTGVDNNGVFNPSIGPGTYTITYSYTDATSGCGEGIATRTITVTPVVANSDLNILNANTDTPLYALVDGLKIQKSAIGNIPLGIVYEPGTDPSNVKFKLTGPISRNTIEGQAPYSLYGDIGVDIQGTIFPVGAYTLVVTPSNGSAITVNFEVTDIDPICAGFSVAVQSTSNPTICNGTDGSVTLAITGGAAPFTFDWNHDATLESGNATQLSAGSYTVTVSDTNGCTKTVSANLVAPSPPSVSLAPFSDVLTTASPITLSGGLPTGGTFSGVGVGNNGVFDPSIGPGTYTITYSYTNSVTGCSGSANRTISVVPEVADSGLTILNANTDTPLYALVDGLQIQKSDIGDTPLGIVFDAETNPRTVKFTLTGPLSRNYTEGLAPFSLYGDIGVDIQGKVFPIGLYTLVVKPNNAPAVTVNFSVLQGVSNTAKAVNNMKMSPNPAIDRTTVSFGETVQLTKFYVYDTTGRLVKTIESETGGEVESMELSVYDLPIGAYFVRTTDTTGKEFQQQMVIKK